MSEEDFAEVCSKIDENACFLNEISQDIWQTPELGLEEVHAHEILTKALEKCGFTVQKSYILSTAFRAEYRTKSDSGPTIAVLLEYDALPDIGHACGHNLIAEAGLAAGIAIKSILEKDPSIAGKLVLLGTPAEENKGGKIILLDAKVFDEFDAAMMVHPTKFTSTFPPMLISPSAILVDFHGKESHAAAFPWEGCNALDAVVACYQSIALLRQQIKPSCRIHAIITNGGKKTNIIPALASMEICMRAFTKVDLRNLHQRISTCIRCAADSTGCTFTIREENKTVYESLLSNKVMGNLFEEYAKRLGMEPENNSDLPAGSSDMGNVSWVVPAMHPFYNIDTQAFNHTPLFNTEAGGPKAQEPTLKAAKAMAMTAIKLFRSPQVLAEVKNQFKEDILKYQ